MKQWGLNTREPLTFIRYGDPAEYKSERAPPRPAVAAQPSCTERLLTTWVGVFVGSLVLALALMSWKARSAESERELKEI